MVVLTRSRVRFGPFELDPQSGELFKLGQKLNLHGQPIEVLSILLEHPGELVTREEFCHRLWPQDTFVDFEHSLNTAIKKLRQSLDDDPDAPRYIETLPKKGYRFVAQVEVVRESVAAVESPPEPAKFQPEPALPKPKRWQWPVAALVLLALVVGAAYWLLRPRTPVVTAIHQLTHTGGHKGQTYAYSPVTDGTRVYFDEFKDGKWHVAQVSTKGGEVSYLDLPQFTNPFVLGISDDGTELVIFEGGNVGGNEGTFWLAPLPNGPVRRIPGTYYAVWLLPGSNQIFYHHTGDYYHLFAADRDGSHARSLLQLPLDSTLPSISPDGTRIRYGTSDNKIWEINLDGTGKHRILPEFNQPASWACCANWPPDGRLFLLSSPASGVDNLWAVNESGWSRYRPPSRPTQLTFGPISFAFATASRDGKRVYALGQTLRGELSTLDVPTGEFRKYLKGMSGLFTDFSRDGQWVTYVSHPQKELWRSRIDGSERLQLTFPPLSSVLNPRWSPDGRFIVVSTDYPDQNKVYLVSADGGAPMLLLSGDFEPTDASWSPDGKFLAYGGAPLAAKWRFPNVPRSEIRILELATKQWKTVPGSNGLFSPRWSPDGRYLVALSDNMKQLFLYDVASPRWHPLPMPKLPAMAVVGWPAWSHDSRSVHFISGVNVYKLHIPGGQPELVASAVGADICYGWFGLTPDDQILMLLDRSIDELYALDLEYR